MVTLVLDLKPDSGVPLRTFNAKLRDQIRKVEKSGLQFVVVHLEILDGSMRFLPGHA